MDYLTRLHVTEYGPGPMRRNRWAELRTTIPVVKDLSVQRFMRLDILRRPSFMTEDDAPAGAIVVYRDSDGHFWRSMSPPERSRTLSQRVKEPFTGLARQIDRATSLYAGAIHIPGVDEVLFPCHEPKVFPEGPQTVSFGIGAGPGIGLGQLDLIRRDCRVEGLEHIGGLHGLANSLRGTGLPFVYDVLADHSEDAGFVRLWLAEPSPITRGLLDGSRPWQRDELGPELLARVKRDFRPTLPMPVVPPARPTGSTVQIVGMSRCPSAFLPSLPPVLKSFAESRQAAATPPPPEPMEYESFEL